MRSKKLYRVYNVKDIPKIWKLAEEDYDSSNLIGVSHCSGKGLVDYIIWLGDVNDFIKDKKYVKYQFNINERLSDNIAYTHNELGEKGLRVNTIIENPQNKEYLDVFYII